MKKNVIKVMVTVWLAEGLEWMDGRELKWFYDELMDKRLMFAEYIYWRCGSSSTFQTGT
jgi:hypothetical protein